MLCTALEAGDFIERLNTDTEDMGKVTGTNCHSRATSPGVYFTTQRFISPKNSIKEKERSNNTIQNVILTALTSCHFLLGMFSG